MKDMFLAEELGLDPYQPTAPDHSSFDELDPSQVFEAAQNAGVIDEVLGKIYDWHQNCEHGENGECEIHDAINAGKSEREIIEIAYYVDSDLFDRFDFMKALSPSISTGQKPTNNLLMHNNEILRFTFERDDDDEGLFVCGYSQIHKDVNGGDLNIAHLHIPDDASGEPGGKYSLGDIDVDSRYRSSGIASYMVDLMSAHLEAKPTGAYSVFSADGQKWWDKYSDRLTKREVAITNQKREAAFSILGSGHGFISADDTVWFNSSNLELRDFISSKDFIAWNHNKNADVEFVYRYLVGHRDKKGMITYISPEMKYDPIDQKEDGSDVWSSPVIMRGEKILACAVSNPTSEQRVMATNMSLDSKREMLRECNEDPHGGLDPIGMMDRIKSVYDLNVSSMGGERIIKFLSETYSFSPEVIKDVVENYNNALLGSNLGDIFTEQEPNSDAEPLRLKN